MSRAASLLLILGTLGACTGELSRPVHVEDTRPLAARLEVEGDPGRAWPMPGERASLRWLLAHPSGAASVGWAFAVCPAIVAPTGQRFCASEPIAFAQQPTPTTAEPVIDFAVPAEDALGPFGALLVTGIFCPGGSPIVDPATQEARCEGGTEPRLLVEHTVPIARDAPNMNPSFADDWLRFDGAVWPEPAVEPPATGCAALAGGPELPLRARSGEAAVLTLTAPESEREAFLRGDALEREQLIFGHYTTHGDPARLYSVLDEAAPSAELEWTPPAEDTIEPDGTLARFWFVVIDERGGADWARRYVCLTP